MSKVINGVSYTDHEDVMKILKVTPEEEAEASLKAKIICELIEERERANKTQTQLAKETGISQSRISRIESGEYDTQISTIIRLLYPLGKTLDIVPLIKN